MSDAQRRPELRIRRQEAGAVLIIATVVLVMMTLVGLMAIQMVAVEVDAVGAERNADSALYIAEAGIQWGLQELQTYNFTPGSPDYTPLDSLPEITATGPWAPQQLVGFRELHPGEPTKAYGGGYFRVVVAVMPKPNEDTLVVRSLGVVGTVDDGAKRLLEVVVEPGS